LRQAFVLKLLVAAVVVFPLLHAVRLAEPADQAAIVRISTVHHAAKAVCAPMAAPAQGLCYEQAAARKKVARAELEYGVGVGGDADDRRKLLEARAEAAYSVARQVCGALIGGAKNRCIEQARAEETNALADAGSARLEAAPRPGGAPVQRAGVKQRKPASAPFKAVAL
jgi:hypothetical protein